jgi:hypothetical protein
MVATNVSLLKLANFSAAIAPFQNCPKISRSFPTFPEIRGNT